MLLMLVVAAVAPVTEPVWLRRPNAEQVASAYPSGAMRDGIEGDVTLDCTVTEAGALAECVLASEAPEGMGFAAATQKLSAGMFMKPRDRQGQLVAGRPFKLTIRWALPGGGARTLPKLEVRRPGMPTGQITLDCRINPEADLEDCQVVGAAARGLEAAAMEVVAAINAASPVPADRGTGRGRVHLPIAFTN